MKTTSPARSYAARCKAREAALVTLLADPPSLHLATAVAMGSNPGRVVLAVTAFGDYEVNRVLTGPGDMATNMRLGKDPWTFRMDNGAGDGSDPAATGTVAMAGGLDPSDRRPNFFEFESDANGGLFVFDANEPLKLVQFMAALDASVAWTLTLRPLRDTSMGIPIATGTSQVVRVDLPAIILPEWGIGFTAATQGSAFCTVARY